MAKILIILIIFHAVVGWSNPTTSVESVKDESGIQFTGTISRLNGKARLARIRTDFNNIKFLNRKDRVEFWNEIYPNAKCIAWVKGRTNDYLLLKIPQYDTCVKRVHFTTGSYLHFESSDLAQTIKTVKELVEILLKKRLAIDAKKERHKRDLSGHVEKVDAVNKRYEILRQKLEIEWQKELYSLEEDKARTFAEFKNSEARLNEIDTKLEAYRMDDHNLKLDRWSLDPALYIRK
jgi:hypothetical protein